MIKFTFQQKVLVAVIVAVVLTIGGYQLAKQVQAYNALCQQLAQAENNLKNFSTINDTLIEEKQKLEASKEYLRQLKQFFGKDIRDGYLIVILGNEAVQNHVNITKIAPQKMIKHEYYRQQPIQICMQGDYYNILLYIDRLGNLAQEVNYSEITSFSIRPLTETLGQQGVVECLLTLVVYADVVSWDTIQWENNSPVATGKSNPFLNLSANFCITIDKIVDNKLAPV